MKSFYSLLLLFMCLSLTYGQNQILKTKLVYTSQAENADSAEDDSAKINNYIPEKYSENALSLINLTYGDSDAYTTYDLYTKKKFIQVSIDGLDNNLSIENSYYYPKDIDSLFQDYYFYKTKDVVKTPEKNTILGYSCQYYTLTSEEGIPPISLCVDVKNAINNASYFLPNKNIKGLVLDIRQQFYSERGAHFTLTNVEKVNVSINFDYEKELQKMKDRIIEAEAEAYSADVEEEETIEYESFYKNLDLNDISLAVDSPDLEYLLNSIPKHCANLKEAIPSFENKELKNLVHNYTGQICDLYLYEIEDSQVDLKGTFERIRKAVLQLENIKEDLNNSDKQKLKMFLNSLD